MYYFDFSMPLVIYVRYLLDIGVTIPTHSLLVPETQCEQCEEKRLIIDDYHKHNNPDLCMRAIHDNKLNIVKLLEEHGSQTCKSFTALRCAVTCGSEDVVSYLLNKYTYPVNIEYIINNSCKTVSTLLAERFSKCTANITRKLLDHGADPAKSMCSPRSVDALIIAIVNGRLDVLALYFLSLLGLQLYNSIGKKNKKKMNTLHSQIARSEFMHYFAN